MPDIGRTSADSATDFDFENQVMGLLVTMPEDGDISSITAYVKESATANTHVTKGALYNNNTGALLGQTSTRQDLGLSYGWVTFTFAAPISVVAGVPLLICITAGGGGGFPAIGYTSTGTSGDSRSAAIAAFPTLDDPETFTNETALVSIYATYTASGGGAGNSSTVEKYTLYEVRA